MTNFTKDKQYQDMNVDAALAGKWLDDLAGTASWCDKRFSDPEPPEPPQTWRLVEDSNDVVYEKWKKLPECSIGRRVVHFKSDPGYEITTDILGGFFQGIRWDDSNDGRAYWIMVREWGDPEEEARVRKETLTNPEKYINAFISDILLFPIVGPAIMYPVNEEIEPDILMTSPFDVNTGKCYIGDGDHDYYTQTTVRAFPEAITIDGGIYLFDENRRLVAIYKDGEVEACHEGEPAAPDRQRPINFRNESQDEDPEKEEESSSLPEESRGNKEAVAQDGTALQYAAKELRRDEDVIAAVAQNDEALQYGATTRKSSFSETVKKETFATEKKLEKPEGCPPGHLLRPSETLGFISGVASEWDPLQKEYRRSNQLYTEGSPAVNLVFQGRSWKPCEFMPAVLDHMMEIKRNKKGRITKKAWIPKAHSRSLRYQRPDLGIMALWRELLYFSGRVREDGLNIIEVPAGRVKKGQCYIQTAVNEVFEEAGYDILCQVETTGSGSGSKGCPHRENSFDLEEARGKISHPLTYEETRREELHERGDRIELMDKCFIGFTPVRHDRDGVEVTTAGFVVRVDRKKQDENWRRVLDQRRPSGQQKYQCPHAFYKFMSVDQASGKHEKSELETIDACWMNPEQAIRVCDPKSKAFIELLLDPDARSQYRRVTAQTVHRLEDKSCSQPIRVSGVFVILQDEETGEIQLLVGDRHGWTPELTAEWDEIFEGNVEEETAPYQIYTIPIFLGSNSVQQSCRDLKWSLVSNAGEIEMRQACARFFTSATFDTVVDFWRKMIEYEQKKIGKPVSKPGVRDLITDLSKQKH
jgi:8-oxo-dGTP pyrophosphatase MutT (NUDIX family)